MGDILKYRIPNSEINQKTGSFNRVDLFHDSSGFVITTFDKQERFLFSESEDAPEFHFSKNKPIVDSKVSYLKNAELFLEQFTNSDLEKAILSRVKRVEFKNDPNELFHALCEQYPKAFVYLVSSKLFGTWIGATPEVLLSGKNKRYFTFALAGTKSADQNLEWSTKEYEEQAYVSSFIRNNLTQSGVVDLIESNVETINVGPVEHLRTDFNFTASDTIRMEIAESLHPTPAVSGTPRDKSISFIQSVESHNRSLYAGYIGSVGDDLELFVNLRCAQLLEGECYLYLGGGLTKDSDAEKEWIETENKAKTLLNVIENL